MSSETTWHPAEGGCPCKLIRYRMECSPLVVHCCHCTSCQKENGSAFALNAMIEAKNFTILSDTSPVCVPTPTESGTPQKMYRCSTCQATVFSIYSSSDMVYFVRVGTLDDPSVAPPDVHIYTRSKQPWMKLDDSIPEKTEYYVRDEIWCKESLARRQAMLDAVKN